MRAVARHKSSTKDRSPSEKGERSPSEKGEASRNAVRIHRHIERRKQGRKVYALELDEVNIEEMLIHEGLLAPGLDHNHKAVVAALAEFISRLATLMKY